MPRCQTQGLYQHTPVTEEKRRELTGTSPDGTSEMEKETMRSRRVDLAAPSKLFEAGPRGGVCAFPVSLLRPLEQFAVDNLDILVIW